jgi:hypothetical protein
VYVAQALSMAIAAGIFLMDVQATRLCLRATPASSSQRKAQLLFIWLMPLIGALLCLALLREESRRVRDGLPKPVDEALRFDPPWDGGDLRDHSVQGPGHDS